MHLFLSSLAESLPSIPTGTPEILAKATEKKQNFSLEMQQIAASVKQFTNLFQEKRYLFFRLCVCPCNLHQTLQKM